VYEDDMSLRLGPVAHHAVALLAHVLAALVHPKGVQEQLVNVFPQAWHELTLRKESYFASKIMELPVSLSLKCVITCLLAAPVSM